LNSRYCSFGTHFFDHLAADAAGMKGDILKPVAPEQMNAMLQAARRKQKK